MNGSVEGALVAIPADGAVGAAKIIFRSGYFAETICLKLYRKRLPEAGSIAPDDFSGPFDLYYTSLGGFKTKRWRIVGTEPVSDDEKALTRRTSGDEIWIGDTHLGAATAADLATLPKMLVHGYRLIEKYAGRHPVGLAG